jgi:nicotinamidase-related amidase
MTYTESDKSPFITRNDSVLVIIDMQEKLVPAMSRDEIILANTTRLLALASTINLPVVVTEQGKLGPTLPSLSSLIAGFEPISKMTFNCFATEAFSQRIDTLGRNTLIIAGIEAHICVTQTALWACRQFKVHVASDAISSRAPDNAAVAVERMRAQGITISSTEMVIYELLERAGTDEFKAMLPYVK